MTRTVLLLVLCLSTVSIWGADTPADDDDKLPLSSSGLRRIQKNINILDQNLKDAQSNIEVTDKNIATIKAELDSLGGLETEHNDLKKKFNAYLAETGAQMQKNDKELAKISVYEKEYETTKKKLDGLQDEASKVSKERYRVQLDKARSDRAELTKWKTDTEANTKRINTLVKELNDSLAQLQVRKNQLNTQVKSWQQRRKEFQQLMSDYRGKKAQLEKTIAERK